jgi:HlyD family secretion protein
LSAHHRAGLATFAALLAIVIGWAWIMPLAGAVVVGGTFVVHSSAKKIQHKTGGVVKEIDVHDGQKVKEVAVLIRLDSNEAKAQNDAAARQIDEIQLRIARLMAERDGGKLALPAKGFVPPDEFARMAKAEADFFKARQATQAGIQKLAQARLAQLAEEIAGYRSQIEANKRQLAINDKELDGMDQLFQKKIAPIQKLTPLQREKARLQGSSGQLDSAIKANVAKIGEIKLEAQQSAQGFRADVMRDLSEASARLGQLLESYLVTSHTLQHTDIIAPVSGAAHEVSVHTVGGVINPGETIMTIIPDDDRLEVAVRLSSDRIDQVRIGQRARIKLTAFERTTPDIEGAVKFISPDLVESKSGAYYDVRLDVDQHPHGMNLTPGMPAEVFIETDKRTMLSYLFKPVTEQMGRMFRER